MTGFGNRDVHWHIAYSYFPQTQGDEMVCQSIPRPSERGRHASPPVCSRQKSLCVTPASGNVVMLLRTRTL
eukprot:6193157-Pleurochrysis_carterae.AAC.3